MPATKFICPDKEEISIGECLYHCRMASRCLTLPTLITIASSERPWEGKTSTTRLLNGTMLEYLKVVSEYAIDPKSRAYSLLGTSHHNQLAQVEGEWISEVRVSDDAGGPSGQPDLLEPDESNPGSYLLTDYKTFGSYRVMKILGLVKETKDHPTEVYFKSGRWGKAGSPKKLTVFRQDPTKVEMENEALQLNHYRLLLQKRGYTISGMQLQITVRDGGLQVARERGVTAPIYLVPIPKLDDDTLEQFFAQKHKALLKAVETNTMPEPCTESESWNHRRCKDYCEVAKFCPQGQRVAITGGS